MSPVSQIKYTHCEMFDDIEARLKSPSPRLTSSRTPARNPSFLSSPWARQPRRL